MPVGWRESIDRSRERIKAQAECDGKLRERNKTAASSRFHFLLLIFSPSRVFIRHEHGDRIGQLVPP